MLLFGQILATCAIVALIPVAFAAFYYFVLACYSLLPTRLRESRGNVDSKRFAVLLHAENAEDKIADAVKRLIGSLNYDRSKFEVVVVADACDDSTAYVASFNGARVLERRNKWEKGFAYSLEWAIPILISDGFDAIFALDIDAVPLSNALLLLDSAISAGYRAARVPLVSMEKRSFAAEIASAAVNRVNPAGRCAAGFSCGLSHTGFCLTKALLEKIPFATDSADDVGFYESKLVLADEPIAFLSETASLLPPSSLKPRESSSGVPIGELCAAAFAGNPSAFERFCGRTLPKTGTILLALTALFLTGGVLMEAGGRFTEIAQLKDYGEIILFVSSLAAAALFVHFCVSLFACYSDSILRRAVGRHGGLASSR